MGPKKYLQNIYLLAVVIGLISFIFFLPNLNDGFLSDDYDFLARMDNATNFSTITETINPPNQSFWRPILNASFLVNYSIFGEQSAISYHFINNLLHALTAIFIFLAFYELLEDKKTAFLGSLLFAIYPMHHESVTWIAGRTDLLAALFFVSSLYLFILYLKRNKLYFYILSLLLFVLASLSKEMALSLPIIFFLVDIIWFKKDVSLKSYLKKYLPLILVLLLYFAGRYFSIHQLVGGYSSFGKTTHLNLSLFSPLISPVFYFTKILNYSSLATYPIDIVAQAGAFALMFRKYIILAFFIILAIFINKNKKIYKNVLLLYLLAVVSVMPAWSMLRDIQINGESSRFLYIPSIFISIFLAYTLVKIKNGLVSKIIITLVVCFFALANYNNYLPWQQATKISNEVKAALYLQKNTIKNNQMTYVLNLPDNHFGAYLFRNGFEEMAENTLGDETIFSNNNSKKIWQIKNIGEISHMCQTNYLPPTAVLIWNDKNKNFITKNELISNLSNQQKQTYKIEEKTNYNEVKWKNSLWFGNPEYFIIQYPKNLLPDSFINTCPLWLISY